MTEKQLAANRRNALKSTGPKTSGGKVRSSRNSLKHGALTAAPILPGVESRKAWEDHRAGVLKSLAPVGYLENLLAVRLAIVSWRLSRIVRYEAEVAAAAVAAVEPDLEDLAESGSGKPQDPAEACAKVEAAFLIAEVLKNLPKMTDEQKLDTDVAVAALRILSEQLPDDRMPVSVPGIPDADEEFGAFDSWTAGLLRKVIEVYAGTTRVAPEAMRIQSISSAGKNFELAMEEERDLLERGRLWKLRLEQENRRRMLLDPDVLAKITRYESNLERSFFKTLHEIQRLQASRAGVDVPVPAAIDVDLNVHPDGSM